MQEQQHVAVRHLGAGIHLHGPAALGYNRFVGEGTRQLRGAVIAAAIGDDDLDPAPAKYSQRLERRLDAGGLVEHRHDDGELHSAASFKAPPQLEP